MCDKLQSLRGRETLRPAPPTPCMPLLASDALILRTYTLGETSKVVVLLTRERGKLRAVAKGARGKRSRYQSALEPLSEVRVTLYGRQGTELFRLGQCELVRSAFPATDAGLEATLTLSYFAELIDAFSPEAEAEDAVYRLAVAVLAAAAEGRPPALLARYIEAWLLRLGGLYPPLDRCSACGRGVDGPELRYHAPAHGFVCAECGPATGPILGAGVRALLQDVFRRSPSSVGDDPRASAELDGFHQELIGRHIERPLRSRRVMLDVAAGAGLAAEGRPPARRP
jgi:DNA repair protein RecO (recombination protein O)